MYSISKKRLYITGIILILIAGGWFWYAKQKIAVSPIEGEIKTIYTIPGQNVPDNQSPETQVSQGNEIDSIKDLIDGEYTFTPVDTSKWQTYRNETMGFEVKIPKDWYYSDENGGACLRKIGKKYQAEMSENECAVFISAPDRYSKERLNFHEYVTKRKQGYNELVKTFNMDDLKSVVIQGGGSLEADAFRNQKAWVISSSYTTDLNVLLTYNALLQTFKFIN